MADDAFPTDIDGAPRPAPGKEAVNRAKGLFLRIANFELQRQTLPAGADIKAESKWETVSIEPLQEILSAVTDFSPDVLDDNVVDPAITAPIPKITDGDWDGPLGHPKLAKNGRGRLVFRFFDFRVTPGHYYRYRVRLRLTNPYLYNDSADPFASRGAPRWTEWSQPTAAVFIPEKEMDARTD